MTGTASSQEVVNTNDWLAHASLGAVIEGNSRLPFFQLGCGSATGLDTSLEALDSAECDFIRVFRILGTSIPTPHDRPFTCNSPVANPSGFPTELKKVAIKAAKDLVEPKIQESRDRRPVMVS